MPDEFASPLAGVEAEADAPAEETEIGRTLPEPQPKCDDSKSRRAAESKTRRLMDEISESGRQKPIRGSEWLATGIQNRVVPNPTGARLFRLSTEVYCR